MYYLAAIMLSGLLVLESVFTPAIVSSRSELAQVKLGAPLPFVVQDHSRYDPSLYDPSLPWRVSFDSSLGVPTWIFWPQLLLDVALVSGAFVVVLHVILALFSLLLQRLFNLLPQFLQPPKSEPVKAVYHLGAFMLSGLLVLASLFVPVTVSSKIDLEQVKLGLPLPWVIQDQSRYDPPFPWRVHFYSPLEVPTWILLSQFLFDVVLVFGAIVVTVRVIKEVLLRTLLLRRQYKSSRNRE